MKPVFDENRLDVAAFAQAGASLEGEWPLSRMDRLAEAFAPEAPPSEDDTVAWRVTGEQRQLRGGQAQTWLHLQAQTEVRLECQRCLKPVGASLMVNRSILFVAGETEAEALDAESEDDVLALTRALDVPELLEDELLLALPLVPRHDVCPSPLPVPEEVPEEKAPHPFAALAALKKGQLPN
jgi:uncharacterized protein